MSTWFIDPEGGSNNNSGDSYAVDATFADGIVTGGTALASASNPFLVGHVGRWININTIGTVKISAFTDAGHVTLATAVTNATYTCKIGGRVLDATTGLLNFNGSTALRPLFGETVKHKGSPAPVALTVTGTLTNKSKTLTLSAGVTLNVTDCETAWTAANTATAVTDATDFKENTKSAKVTLPAVPVVSTKYASFQIGGGGNVDFSAYKQISLYIKSSVAVIAGNLKLCLCSDTAGATPVNTISIPALPGAGQWQPITVDTGGALSATVQSVALYADTTVTGLANAVINLDNIIACKDSTVADALTLTSLVGLNTAGETFYGLQSINGTTVKIDNGTNTLGSAGRGYTGTGGAGLTIYRRETIKLPMMAASGTVGAFGNPLVTGTSSGNVVHSGGWDRTNMSTQTLDTWYDGQNGFGQCFWWGNNSYLTITNFGVVRCGYAFYSVGGYTGNVFDLLHANNNSVYGFANSGYVGTNTGGTIIANNNGLTAADSSLGIAPGYDAIFTAMTANGNQGSGVYSSSQHWVCTTVLASNNGGPGWTHRSGANTIIGNVTCSDNGSYGFYVVDQGNAFIYITDTMTLLNNGSNAINDWSYGPIIINNLTTSGNTSPAILSNGSSHIYARNTQISEAAPVGGLTNPSYQNALIYLEKYGGTPDDVRLYRDGGTIQTVADATRHTGSGVAWRLSPTHAGRRADYPLDMQICELAVNANALVTVSAWLRRSNANMVMRIKCKKKQLTGMAADVSATMSGGTANNVYEQVTFTFTPTEAGVVEFFVEGYPSDGNTGYSGIIDDMTVSQA